MLSAEEATAMLLLQRMNIENRSSLVGCQYKTEEVSDGTEQIYVSAMRLIKSACAFAPPHLEHVHKIVFNLTLHKV